MKTVHLLPQIWAMVIMPLQLIKAFSIKVCTTVHCPSYKARRLPIQLKLSISNLGRYWIYLQLLSVLSFIVERNHLRPTLNVQVVRQLSCLPVSVDWPLKGLDSKQHRRTSPVISPKSFRQQQWMDVSHHFSARAPNHPLQAQPLTLTPPATKLQDAGIAIALVFAVSGNRGSGEGFAANQTQHK